jgi:NAD(P)H dehydrogenase (quinone)
MRSHIRANTISNQSWNSIFRGDGSLAAIIAWSPAHVGDEGRQQYLEAYKQRLLDLESTPVISYRPMSDYDQDFKLKPRLEA